MLEKGDEQPIRVDAIVFAAREALANSEPANTVEYDLFESGQRGKISFPIVIELDKQIARQFEPAGQQFREKEVQSAQQANTGPRR